MVYSIWLAVHCKHNQMAKAYSNDLRRKLLEAYDRGEGSLRERIEAVGATLLYLPTHSPDFNPIEQTWSKIKQHLRKTKARTLDRLEYAVAQALATVTSQDAQGWFRHCGYAMHNCINGLAEITDNSTLQ